MQKPTPYKTFNIDMEIDRDFLRILSSVMPDATKAENGLYRKENAEMTEQTEPKKSNTQILTNEDNTIACLYEPDRGVFGPVIDDDIDADARTVAEGFIDAVEEFLAPHDNLVIEDLSEDLLARIYREFDPELDLEDN